MLFKLCLQYTHIWYMGHNGRLNSLVGELGWFYQKVSNYVCIGQQSAFYGVMALIYNLNINDNE